MLNRYRNSYISQRSILTHHKYLAKISSTIRHQNKLLCMTIHIICCYKSCIVAVCVHLWCWWMFPGPASLYASYPVTRTTQISCLIYLTLLPSNSHLASQDLNRTEANQSMSWPFGSANDL